MTERSQRPRRVTHRAIYVPRIEASVFIAMLKLRYVTNSSLNSTTRSIIRHPYFNQFTDKVRERERASQYAKETVRSMHEDIQIVRPSPRRIVERCTQGRGGANCRLHRPVAPLSFERSCNPFPVPYTCLHGCNALPRRYRKDSTWRITDILSLSGNRSQHPDPGIGIFRRHACNFC